MFTKYGWENFAVITSSTFAINMVFADALRSFLASGKMSRLLLLSYGIHTCTDNGRLTAAYVLDDALMNDAARLDDIMVDLTNNARSMHTCTN